MNARDDPRYTHPDDGDTPTHSIIYDLMEFATKQRVFLSKIPFLAACVECKQCGRAFLPTNLPDEKQHIFCSEDCASAYGY